MKRKIGAGKVHSWEDDAIGRAIGRALRDGEEQLNVCSLLD